MSYAWEVTFHQVADPEEMKGKLERHVFFRKCAAAKVETTSHSVVFSFAQEGMDRQKIRQKNQTFKSTGTYTSYTITECAAAAPAAPAPEATLARRSTVEDIKRLAAGLTNAEVHSLAVFFACRYAQQPQPWTALSQLMADKRAAAAAFTKPAEQWEHLLGQCAPLHDVACGLCGVRSTLCRCHGCGRYCCARCIPWEPAAKCCGCTRTPRLSVDLAPPIRMGGFEWYFHYPMEDALAGALPKRCFAENRDTQRDPLLLDIVEVRKNFRLEKVGRLTRPPEWESAFTVLAVLAAPDGTHKTVGINLFAFMMNPSWRQHSIVKYIKEEFMLDPRHLDFVGPILKVTAPVMPAPPSPPSPVVEELLDEVGELRPMEGMEEMRQELRQLEAALPGSDDDGSPLRLPKRRRVSADEAAQFYDATNYFRR
jgi:hypothetical protein